jgi:hypothetical protein
LGAGLALVRAGLFGQHPAAFPKGAQMKKSPFHPGPLEDLSPPEIEALSAIKDGRKVAVVMYRRLEIMDLAQQKLAGWALTPEGDWRLGAGK